MIAKFGLNLSLFWWVGEPHRRYYEKPNGKDSLMSLDLGKTALQIESMTDDLRARRNDKRRRLDRAVAHIETFDPAEYEEKRARSANYLNWTAPRVESRPSTRYYPPAVPRRLLRRGGGWLSHRR